VPRDVTDPPINLIQSGIKTLLHRQYYGARRIQAGLNGALYAEQHAD
jgi:hypothetical protein